MKASILHIAELGFCADLAWVRNTFSGDTRAAFM